MYFSPSGGCEERVVRFINETHKTLDVAIYSLNNTAILQALSTAKTRGVKIRILLDRVQASGNRAVTLGLRRNGFDVRIHSKNKIQHNKFAVSDGTRIETGSFNWTNPAEHSNEENCLFTDDPTTSKVFERQFKDHLWVVNTEKRSERAFLRLMKKPLKGERK
ncbi:MAG: hypothetical protein JST16_06475 [Bdellovibrionales bacterium]|nr:hypothetical protein [Bdellovibrionales bacterium]